MAQTVINQFLALGIPGEIYDSGPKRVESYTLNSPSAANNVYGSAVTLTAEGKVQAGGTGFYAGILVAPKNAVQFGTSSDPLAAGLTVPNNSPVQVLSMGQIVVSLPAAAAIGDYVIFDNTTGALSTITPGTALPVGKTFANAIVRRFTVAGAGLAVIEVTQQNTNV